VQSGFNPNNFNRPRASSHTRALLLLLLLLLVFFSLATTLVAPPPCTFDSAPADGFAPFFVRGIRR